VFILAPKAAWSSVVVDGPVVALKRSPFFKDIVLVAGGWMFQIWREKIHVNFPLSPFTFFFIYFPYFSLDHFYIQHH
jgi:hypothetical protein